MKSSILIVLQIVLVLVFLVSLYFMNRIVENLRVTSDNNTEIITETLQGNRTVMKEIRDILQLQLEACQQQLDTPPVKAVQ